MAIGFDVAEVRRIALEVANRNRPALSPDEAAKLKRELRSAKPDVIAHVSAVMGADPTSLECPIHYLRKAEYIEARIQEDIADEERAALTWTPEEFTVFSQPYFRDRRTQWLGDSIGYDATEIAWYKLEDGTVTLHVDNLAHLSPTDRRAIQAHEFTHRGQHANVDWLASYDVEVNRKFGPTAPHGNSAYIAGPVRDMTAVLEGEATFVGRTVSPNYDLRVHSAELRSDRTNSYTRGLSFWVLISTKYPTFADAHRAVWASPQTLPRHRELDQPSLWLARDRRTGSGRRTARTMRATPPSQRTAHGRTPKC